MNNNQYALIMAGGVGSRFWPVSTTAYPKQFHDMLGTGETLIQRTVNRFAKSIPAENIFILTHERYKDLVLEQLPEIRQEQLILEPDMRNTAPCILLASLKIKKINQDAVMVVAPSDHWIEDETAFRNNINACMAACAEKDMLMTLGIKPAFPNTGYGYIEYEEKKGDAIKKVRQFREKPGYEQAKEYIARGNFLWNAGIFVWSVKSIIKAFENYQPELLQLFLKGYAQLNTAEEYAFLQNNYPKAENISIDYAVMEPATNIYVLPAAFDWNDLGTWGSLYQELPKDDMQNAVVNGKTLLHNSHGNMIRTRPGKIVIMEDLDDYIVVDKEEVLLIYPKSKEQDIKGVLLKVKNTFGNELT